MVQPEPEVLSERVALLPYFSVWPSDGLLIWVSLQPWNKVAEEEGKKTLIIIINITLQQ